MTIDNNRWQLKNRNFLAIDWSSIPDINRLIVIDCHRLSLIVIDYRFHRLIRPGIIFVLFCFFCSKHFLLYFVQEILQYFTVLTMYSS